MLAWSLGERFGPAPEAPAPLTTGSRRLIETTGPAFAAVAGRGTAARVGVPMSTFVATGEAFARVGIERATGAATGLVGTVSAAVWPPPGRIWNPVFLVLWATCRCWA